MPQEGVTAWSGFKSSGFTGSKFEPLVYVGKQVLRNTLYWFIATQNVMYKDPTPTRIVKLAIKKTDEETYEIVSNTIEQIF